MQRSVKKYKRIVIKVGSSFLYPDRETFCEGAIDTLAAGIAKAVAGKKEIILVSSGAIAIGMSVLKLTQRPKGLAVLQAAAAVGQHFLMSYYSRALRKRNLECAQVLLTWEDFNDRKRYLNAKNTLLELLRLGVVPIVNENDTVSAEEIKFGDNDRLSALVSSLVLSDLLIMLSDVDGLLTADGQVVPLVDKISSDIKALACPTEKKTCVGGMITKLEAAKITMDSGIDCVIANGKKENIIEKVIALPERNGTLFVSQEGLAAKERWIAFSSKPKGKVQVDEGAKHALLHKKSLLSVGITALEGNFEANDVVSLIDTRGSEFARGRTSISSKLLDKVKGNRYHKEIIHCDNIVVL